MRKPDFNIYENKGADQLCSNCTADQPLCFRYTDSTIPPTHIQNFKILSLFYGCIGQLCRTWTEIPKSGFLVMLLN